MAKPGPKPKSAEILEMRGSSRPDRDRSPVVQHIDGYPIKPNWLKGRASRIWDEKVKRYTERGQCVAGCEDALGQYVCLEAELIDGFWRKKLVPPMNMVNAHRIYASEFFDTPASQQLKGKNSKPGNKFSNNGRKNK